MGDNVRRTRWTKQRTVPGDQRTVRLPVSVQPVKIDAAPSFEVATSDAAGTATLPVRAGFAGTLSGLGWGLAPPRAVPGETVATASPASDHPWAPSAGVRTYDVEVPAGAQVLAGAISAGADQDGKGFDAADVVGRSAGPGATESIALALPPPGSYRFAVVGFKTQNPTSKYDFTTWLGADPTPNDPASPSTAPGLVVAGDPKVVSPGDGIELPLAWSGVAADGTYLGLVTYHDHTPAEAPPTEHVGPNRPWVR